MFILTIYCLTTSNLPWFMDLTFQVPMQHYSLRHDFAFNTRHIHNFVLFPFWPSHFILSGAIINSPLLFPSWILDAFWPGELIFQFHFFLPFRTVHGVFQARILKWVAIPPLVDRILSELFGMTCLSWVVLHGMAHSFIELCKPLCLDKAVIHEGDSVLYRFKTVLLPFLWGWLLRGWRK